MATTNGKGMKQVVAVVERGEGEKKKSFWTRIGVAFENRDGSYNLVFDYLPARMEGTTIQLRNFDPKDAKDAKDPKDAKEQRAE